jgi:hypothetical protein
MERILQIEAIIYVGATFFQIYLRKHGKLTAERFAMLFVGPILLMLVTVTIDGFFSPSSYTFGLIMSVVGDILFVLISYPFAKWAYRQFFPNG